MIGEGRTVIGGYVFLAVIEDNTSGTILRVFAEATPATEWVRACVIENLQLSRYDDMDRRLDETVTDDQRLAWRIISRCRPIASDSATHGHVERQVIR